MNTGIHVSVQVSVYSSFGYIPRSGIATAQGHSVFSFWRNCQTVAAPRVYSPLAWSPFCMKCLGPSAGPHLPRPSQVSPCYTLPHFLKPREITSNSWDCTRLPIVLRIKSSSYTAPCKLDAGPHRGLTAASAHTLEHLPRVPGFLLTHLFPSLGRDLFEVRDCFVCIHVVLDVGGAH